MRLVLASNNAKKLAELRSLFEGLPLDLQPQGALGVTEAEEPHDTFVENALVKARHAARAVGGAAIADDSGLCVAALDGAPGVVSAQGLADRRARYVSVLVALRSVNDPEPLIAFGRWEGEILASPQGEGGFGYDPLMFIPALGRTVATLTAATKNLHSHRALAAAQMRQMMQEAWDLA